MCTLTLLGYCIHSEVDKIKSDGYQYSPHQRNVMCLSTGCHVLRNNHYVGLVTKQVDKREYQEYQSAGDTHKQCIHL